MKTFVNPDRKDWKFICSRPEDDHSEIENRVLEIIRKVQAYGDAALLEFSEKFDGVKLHQLKVTEEEIRNAGNAVSADLKRAIAMAKENIHRFHEAQKESPVKIETRSGVEVWRKSVAIEKVGFYIPGGTAPLFSSILMLAVPATIAGVKEMILCTPPGKDGKVHPAVLYTASVCGIKHIFKTGGAQAIAAMAYGTETIPAVYKIFGPGNRYVTFAKQYVGRKDVAIDMPAGPSEVAVFTDGTGNPDFIAADLLSQAEHGTDSQVVLVSTNKEIMEEVLEALHKQKESLPRKSLVEGALSESRMVYFGNADTAMEFLNEYAPEHLIIASSQPDQYEDKIVNAGSVFLGNFSPEAAGDYASGTNHTLPTNGYAKAYSGVSLDTFVKKITFQKISREGLSQLSKAIEMMADAEGLDAHKNAVTIRLKQ